MVPGGQAGSDMSSVMAAFANMGAVDGWRNVRLHETIRSSRVTIAIECRRPPYDSKAAPSILVLPAPSLCLITAGLQSDASTDLIIQAGLAEERHVPRRCKLDHSSESEPFLAILIAVPSAARVTGIPSMHS